MRHEVVLEEALTRPTLLFGASVLVAYVGDADREGAETGAGGARARVDVPLAYAVDFGGLYELWVGARVGLEYVGGRFSDGAVIAQQRAPRPFVRAGCSVLRPGSGGSTRSSS